MKLMSAGFAMFVLFQAILMSEAVGKEQVPWGGTGAASVFVNKQDGARTCRMSRLIPYEPNYAIYQKAQDDEAAIRVHYSFKYSIYSAKEEIDCATVDSERHASYDIYLSYTGEFDFYASTRPSGPVINRISNPAFHARLYKELTGLPLEWIDMGVEHRSNGQVVEPTEPAEIARAQQAYSNNDHQYFDSLSRGADYISLEGHRTFFEKNLSAYAKLKIYAEQNTQITWGPLAGSNTSISDYDRLKLVARNNIGDGELSVEWIIGDKLFKTDSWNIDYLHSRNTPLTLFIRAHFGPMQTLSNYTQSQSAIGFGLKFIP